ARRGRLWALALRVLWLFLVAAPLVASAQFVPALSPRWAAVLSSHRRVVSPAPAWSGRALATRSVVAPPFTPLPVWPSAAILSPAILSAEATSAWAAAGTMATTTFLAIITTAFATAIG